MQLQNYGAGRQVWVNRYFMKSSSCIVFFSCIHQIVCQTIGLNPLCSLTSKMYILESFSFSSFLQGLDILFVCRCYELSSCLTMYFFYYRRFIKCLWIYISFILIFIVKHMHRCCTRQSVRVIQYILFSFARF